MQDLVLRSAENGSGAMGRQKQTESIQTQKFAGQVTM
jgi:hypothetical protein